MDQNRFLHFLQVLEQKTMAGSVSWERTIDENTFRAWIGEGGVRVGWGHRWNDEGPAAEYYTAVLLTEKDEVADVIQAEEGQPGFAVLENIFRHARRSVRSANELIDSMLGHLANQKK